MVTTWSILLAVILVSLTFALYKWLFGSWNYWTSRGIPNVPGAVPIFGNTLPIFRMQENLSTFCTKIYAKYRGKSMVGFYNLKTPVLMVRDPELVKTVLQTSFNNFHENETRLDPKVDPLMGYDPFFVADYQTWKDSRATFGLTLSPKRLKSMSHGMANACEKLENYLAGKVGNRDHLELEAKFLFSKYTTEVAASSVFGIDANAFADDYEGTLLDCMKTSLDPSATRSLIHNVLMFVPPLGKLLGTKFVPSKAAAIYNRVARDVENLRKEDAVPRSDVLQQMLDMVKNGKIPKIEAIGHTFSFFIESYETSSLVLSFMSYLIAKHPDVQNKMREEVEATMHKYEGQMTYEALNEMNYVEQVFNETLRLYPGVGALAKVCSQPYHLEGPDGLAVDVVPGIPVYIPVLGLQMDPEIWVNPEEFNPDRFERSNREGRHKFVFLPFGEGPRACPGQRYGALQVKAAIATIIRNYRIEVSPKMIEPVRLDPRYFLITAAGGYWIKLRPLKNK